MADFELQINDRGFRNLDTRVNFDSNRFSALLDELTEVEFVTPYDTPIVKISPAADWRRSKAETLRMELARDYDREPGSTYSSATKTIDLRAGENVDVANHFLLTGTRRWASDLNGELSEYRALNRQHRTFRRAGLATITGSGAAIGYSFGETSGAFVGGILGFFAGAAAAIADDRRSPYFQNIRYFATDPDVLADYGQILSYEQA